jgi:hypothetical protein
MLEDSKMSLGILIHILITNCPPDTSRHTCGRCRLIFLRNVQRDVGTVVWVSKLLKAFNHDIFVYVWGGVSCREKQSIQLSGVNQGTGRLYRIEVKSSVLKIQSQCQDRRLNKPSVQSAA